MTREQLVMKGVKSTFIGNEFLISVDSLDKHFKGYVYHESDVVETEDGKYVRPSDVSFGEAIEVAETTEETPVKKKKAKKDEA